MRVKLKTPLVSCFEFLPKFSSTRVGMIGHLISRTMSVKVFDMAAGLSIPARKVTVLATVGGVPHEVSRSCSINQIL